MYKYVTKFEKNLPFQIYSVDIKTSEAEGSTSAVHEHLYNWFILDSFIWKQLLQYIVTT